MGKPKCELIGTDGNVYRIIANVSWSLKQAGMEDKAKEFRDKAFAAESYDEVLSLCLSYVDVR